MLFLRVGLTLPGHFLCVPRRGRATGAVRSIIHRVGWCMWIPFPSRWCFPSHPPLRLIPSPVCQNAGVLWCDCEGGRLLRWQNWLWDTIQRWFLP